MSLVNYSSSSSETEDSELEQMLLPKEIKQLNGINNDNPLEDSTNQHDGRIRSFPHERGNWATFVSIPYEQNDSIVALQGDIINNVKTKLILQFHPIETLHISLSKTVPIKFHWIKPFIHSLQNNIGFDTKKFLIELDHLNVYCNEDKTRTFISICVAEANCDRLKNLVNSVDRSFTEFNLEQFYNNPSFHVSILWCLGDHKKIINSTAILNDLHTLLNNAITNDYDDFQISFHNIECKIGKQIYNLPLR